MFSLFGAKDRKTKTVFIADVGSGSIGCAVAELNREGPPKILLSERSAVPVLQSLDAASLMRGMQKAFGEVSNRLQGSMARALASVPEKDRPRLHPTHAAVFLRAPWCDVLLRNIRFARERPFRATPAVLERMLSDYVRRERPDEKEEEVVERSAVGIRLNGYAVPDMPRSAMVGSIELTALSVTAPRVFLKQVREGIAATCGRVQVSIHSAGIAASFAMGSLLPQESDYILCEVGGESTELLLVLEHIPVARATFSTGANLFTRTLEAHAGMKGGEGASALRLAKEKRSPMRAKLGSTLSVVQKEYAKAFGGAVRELVAAAGSAHAVYLLCEEPAGHFVEQAVEQAASSGPAFPAGASVRLIGPDILGSFIARGTSLGAPDLPLSLCTLFAAARFDESRAFNFKL